MADDEKREKKKEKKEKKHKKTFPLNARIKIVNYDEEPDLNECIGYVRSKPKKSGRIKIIFPNTTDTMKIPTECVQLCALPISVITEQAREYIAARVRLISACDEDQKSTEKVGSEGGACTSALLNILYEHQNTSPDKDLNFGHIIKDMRQILESRGYQQKPNLSSSRPMQLTTPWEFVPATNFSGKRRALIIGIQYKGMPWELLGSQNDCHNMIKYLKGFQGFQDRDFTILMDDDKHTPPTRANMLEAFRKFAFECHPNDAVYFHFAGHGGSVPDESGDETDGMDETLYPMDYLESGEILDDEIFEELLLNIPGGVTLNAMVDSCHSGSVFDLPFELFGPGKGQDQEYSAIHFPHMDIAKEHRRKLEAKKQGRNRNTSNKPSPEVSAKKSHAPQERSQRRRPPPPQQSNERSFPLESTVVLVGLERNPQLNGRTGLVKSRLDSNGRQHVFIKGLTRSFALKPVNMQLQR